MCYISSCLYQHAPRGCHDIRIGFVRVNKAAVRRKRPITEHTPQSHLPEGRELLLHVIGLLLHSADLLLLGLENTVHLLLLRRHVGLALVLGLLELGGQVLDLSIGVEGVLGCLLQLGVEVLLLLLCVSELGLKLLLDLVLGHRDLVLCVLELLHGLVDLLVGVLLHLGLLVGESMDMSSFTLEKSSDAFFWSSFALALASCIFFSMSPWIS